MPLSFPTSPTNGQVYTVGSKSWQWNSTNSSWDISTSTSVMTTLGDIIYGAGSGVATRLAGNISTTRAFLGQTGTGSVSAAPSWTSSTGTGNVVLASGPSISNLILTGTLTANASVGSSGQYLESTGTGVRWTSVSGYSAPTIGSTTISSGSTVTTIAGLTLTTPTIDTINTSLTTTGTAALWNTGLTTGTIAIGGAVTTGTITVGGTAVTSAGTINILTGATTSGTKTINIGTSGTTGSTTTINIGTTGGTTPTITLNGTVNTASGSFKVGNTTLAQGVTGTITFPASAGTLALNPTTTIGDLIYASATGTPGTLARLSGNTATQPSFLSSSGNGTANTTTQFVSSTGSNNVVLSTSPTITTPTIDAINASGAAVAATLWDSTLTSGSITIGSALTGNMTLANATGFAGTIAIANASTSAHTINISNGAGTTNKTINIGTGRTSGTTAITIGSSSGATSTVALNGAVTGNSTITGTSFIPSGSTVPANGMYLPAANTIAFSSNSTQRLGIDANGTIEFFSQVTEAATVSATAAATTVTYDVMTNKNVLYYTSNATANWTFNVRGNATTTLNTLMEVGQSLTVVFMVTTGATAYYPTAFQIDGSAVTPKWFGGTAPTAGNASSVDVYTYNIIKTAATPTYTVFASQSRFA